MWSHIGQTAEQILQNFSMSSTEKDTEKEKLRIIGTAAKLLLSDRVAKKLHLANP